MASNPYRPIFMLPYIGKILGVIMIPVLPIIVVAGNLWEENFFWEEVVTNYKDLFSFLKGK